MSDKLALVVLGVHRSGTSVMTRVLGLSGFATPRSVLLPQPDNPTGFWESPVVVALNDELLEMQDAEWHDVFPPDDAPFLSNWGAVSLAKAEAALASEFEGAPRIVLKDPRISILASFWKRALDGQGYQSVFVIMVRHPMEVARSLSKRDGFSLDRGLLLWLTHMLASERKSRGSRRIFITYGELLEDPISVLDRIEATMGEPFPRRTRASELEVQRALNDDLRHHKAGRDIGNESHLASMVSQAYGWLLAAAEGEEPDPEIMDKAANWLQACEQTVGGVLAEMRTIPQRLHQELAETRQALSDARAQAEAKCAALEGETARFEREVAAHEEDLTALRAMTEGEESARKEAERLTRAWAEDKLAAEIHLSKLQEFAGAETERANGLSEALRGLEGELSAARLALAESADHQQAALREERLRASRLEHRLGQVEADSARTLDLERRRLSAETARLEATHAELLHLYRAEQTKSAALQKTTDDLSSSLRYIHSRTWWRLLTRLRGAIP